MDGTAVRHDAHQSDPGRVAPDRPQQRVTPGVESGGEDGFYSTFHRKPVEGVKQGGDKSELCFKKIALAAESGFLGN